LCAEVCRKATFVSKMSLQQGRVTEDDILNDLLSKLRKHGTENPRCLDCAEQRACWRSAADSARGQPGQSSATILSSSALPPAEPPAIAQARNDAFAFLGTGENLRTREAAALARVQAAYVALKARSAHVAAFEAQLEAAQRERDEERHVHTQVMDDLSAAQADLERHVASSKRPRTVTPEESATRPGGSSLEPVQEVAAGQDASELPFAHLDIELFRREESRLCGRRRVQLCAAKAMPA